MNLKQYLICFIATGLIFGCGERLDTINSFPPPPEGSNIVGSPMGFVQYEPLSKAEFDSILVISKAENKPVLIDVTGLNCVNCRKMEVNVWRSNEVYGLLKNEFIIMSLFVDNREQYPNPDSLAAFNNLTTGAYWSNYQSERYLKGIQPIYDLVNYNNESLVTDLASYSNHKEPRLFKEWLEEGLANFKKQNNE